MTTEEIEKTLIQGIATITNQDEAEINARTPFPELGIDSLGFVEVLVFIEKTFKLALIATDLTRKDFETIESLAAFISKRV